MSVSTRVPLVASLALLLALAGLHLRVDAAPGRAGSPAERQRPQAAGQNLDGQALARQICSTCHVVPPPDILPRSAWGPQIGRMWLILQGLPETGFDRVALPPEWRAVARFYESGAPDALQAPAPWPPPDRTLAFARRTLSPASAPLDPAVSHVRLVDLHGDSRLELVVSDMRHGVVLTGMPYEPEAVLKPVAQVPHPAKVEPIDFDGDGILDLLTGDLGAFMASDHNRGAVVWLRGRQDGTYAQMTLENWPPVADVRAADLDADGKRDLVVAAFGWRKTGRLSILKNDTVDYARPGFVPYTLEERSGPIHVPPADLNGDGRPDLVALFSQEHETVVAYLNAGAGLGFRREVIYQAPHPLWGSSGIELTDLDQDGDLDVLLTNGDSFDGRIRRPFHGILWLENRGTFPFTEHRLASFGGAHRAEAADLDGDGDLDIVACALVMLQDEESGDAPRLVWLEQTRPGVFERRTLATGKPTHATVDLGDFDGDGDIDIVVGNFTSGQTRAAWVDVWENLRLSPASTRR